MQSVPQPKRPAGTAGGRLAAPAYASRPVRASQSHLYAGVNRKSWWLPVQIDGEAGKPSGLGSCAQQAFLPDSLARCKVTHPFKAVLMPCGCNKPYLHV